MENLINSENFNELKSLIENKIADLPDSYILIGAVGSLLLSSYLSKNGYPEAGSLIGKLALPVAGIGLAKYKDSLAAAAGKITEKVDEILPNSPIGANAD
ncbi:hypothetical protein K6T82_05675 [Flavobacterium sp. 17A]|uniref:Uncharacterized protein n=1 Tax=Flavobacterium potami TaxID=2872310 RepID=A0A9X1H8S7_9FLAO|nr:hypothetical protein [Flavobacterium potami]MBZ4034246.1 hypothetical protein [Flavobacterium potami]